MARSTSSATRSVGRSRCRSRHPSGPGAVADADLAGHAVPGSPPLVPRPDAAAAADPARGPAGRPAVADDRPGGVGPEGHRGLFRRPTRYPEPRFAEAVEEARLRYDVPWYTTAYVRTFRGLVGSFLRAYLPGAASMWRIAGRITAPTLVISGQRDRLVDLRVAAGRPGDPGQPAARAARRGHVAQMETAHGGPRVPRLPRWPFDRPHTGTCESARRELAFPGGMTVAGETAG